MSEQFRVGDFVMCVDGSQSSLVNGQRYEVLFATQTGVKIGSCYYDNSRFRLHHRPETPAEPVVEIVDDPADPAPWETGTPPRTIADVATTWPHTPSDPRRVSACVNHCEGFSTEALEAGPRMEELVEDCAGLIAEVERLKWQRDMLLEACRAVDNPSNWNEDGNLAAAVHYRVTVAVKSCRD